MDTIKVVIIAVALIIASGIVMMGVIGTSSPRSITTATTAAQNGGMQEVTLSQTGGVNYVMTPGTLTPGVPVRMTVDLNTVKGCMRQVVIPALGVNKYVKDGDNVIEFTPTKSGTFQVTCGMNMGRGTITVGPGGAAPSTADLAPPTTAGGSCGGGGGGCGGR